MSKPQRVLVMGATGGIGSRLSRSLAGDGNRLALVARREAELKALAEELGALAFPLDATRSEAVEGLFDNLKKEWDGLDAAVCCVGSLLLKPAHLTTDEDWTQVLAVNLTAAFLMLRGAAKWMSRGGGSIVLVSSAAAQVGVPNHEAIAAAKAGVAGLALAAAATYGPSGVRVNCVAPGLVRTPMTEKLVSNELSLKASTAMHILGRIGDPEDVASAIRFLLDPEHSWITGQVLGIDGGLAKVRGRAKV